MSQAKPHWLATRPKIRETGRSFDQRANAVGVQSVNSVRQSQASSSCSRREDA